MRCFYPLSAWQTFPGKIVFVNPGTYRRALRLRCGGCIGCRLARSRAWAVRCMNEASLYTNNSYVTLTYSDQNLPEHGQLVYRDFQLFLKRLRKAFSHRDEMKNFWRLPIRFFMCGEYGDNNARPHFHACLFNVSFPDMEYLRMSPSGQKLFRSPLLESLWPQGFSSVGTVTFESAAYVARYICKKITGKDAELHYGRISMATGEIFEMVPEFCQMSLKPGIGREWIKRFKDEVLVRDAVIVNGSPVSVPKYYDIYLESVDADTFGDIKAKRIAVGKSLKADCTPERLAVQETVAKARLSFSKRGKV